MVVVVSQKLRFSVRWFPGICFDVLVSNRLRCFLLFLNLEIFQDLESASAFFPFTFRFLIKYLMLWGMSGSTPNGSRGLSIFQDFVMRAARVLIVS